ncbi:hypothetical protein BJX66DRAFT_289317 [Aspergillus keveii]|uniref:Uncharacterized protein n=1 Tax=Aspergillus keveii TaxID=714993 RepID=A0ABR4GQN4_9EURO
MESPFSEWRVPKHNLLSPATLVLLDSPPSPSRAATPLKNPQLSLKASTLPRSPLRPVGSRRAVSMTTQRFNYYLDGQQFAPAYARRALDYELGSDQDLASSQPVSLAQLYKKTASRNKAGRNSRSFFDDNADYMAEGGRNAVHGTHESYSQRANTGEYTLNNEAGRLTPPQRFVSQGYPWQRHETATGMDQEQSWFHDLNEYQTQRNPLSYTNHGISSQSRNNSGMSESPFLRKMDRSFPTGETWSADATVSQTTPFNTNYSKMQPNKEYIAPSSLQLYRDSFDQPQDKSPYETIRLKHRNNRTDLPEINSGLQFGFNPEAEYEPYTANATIRSEPTPATQYHAKLPNIFDSETTGETLAGRKPLEELEAPKVLATHSRLPSGTSVSQRTIKEEIYAILDNLSLGPNTNSQLTSSPQVSESTETGSCASDAHHEQFDDPSPMPSPRQDSGDGIEVEDEDGDVLELKEDLVDRAPGIREGKCNPSRAHCESKKGRLLKLYASESPLSTEKLPASEYSHKPTETAIKPPPGLSRRFDTEDSPAFPARGTLLQANKLIEKENSSGENKEPACFAANARLQEVDKWFHKDNRGEDELRQHIANIADNFVESREHHTAQAFSKQDNIFAKQLITTVGGVLANLRAYTPQDKRDPARYFANYKDVHPRCYEARMGGQRSYFEWKPTFDSWRRVGGAFLEAESDLQ